MKGYDQNSDKMGVVLKYHNGRICYRYSICMMCEFFGLKENLYQIYSL